ncbi:MAG: hypothetical protein QW385_02140 [Thermoproteota archaeon]
MSSVQIRPSPHFLAELFFKPTEMRRDGISRKVVVIVCFDRAVFRRLYTFPLYLDRRPEVKAIGRCVKSPEGNLLIIVSKHGNLEYSKI